MGSCFLVRVTILAAEFWMGWRWERNFYWYQRAGNYTNLSQLVMPDFWQKGNDLIRDMLLKWWKQNRTIDLTCLSKLKFWSKMTPRFQPCGVIEWGRERRPSSPMINISYQHLAVGNLVVNKYESFYQLMSWELKLFGVDSMLQTRVQEQENVLELNQRAWSFLFSWMPLKSVRSNPDSVKTVTTDIIVTVPS